MKYFLFASLLINSFIYAGSTYCAGKKIHYSFYQLDSGPKPLKGTHTGTQFLSIAGVLKASQETYMEEPSKGVWDLQLNFTKDVTQASLGNKKAGSRIYTAQLSVVDEKNNIIEQEEVVCRKNWKMLH
jgi:hypothetical protein